MRRRHGLDPAAWLEPIRGGAEPAAREAALTGAALAYAEALAPGRLDPARLRDPYSVPRPRFDAPAALNAALDEERDLAAWLAGLAPQDDGISRAFRGLSRRAAAASGRARPIPAGARHPARRRRSAARRDRRRARRWTAISSAGATGRARATAAMLLAAVRRLQEDYGLTANGVITGRHARRDQRGRDRPGARARGQSRAAALAGARGRRRRGSTSTPPPPTLTYWRDSAGRRPPPRRGRRARQRDARARLAHLPPGRQPDLDRAALDPGGARSRRAARAIWRATTWNGATAGSSSAPARPIRSAWSSSTCRTRTPSICTTRRPRRLFGAGRPPFAAMAASGFRTRSASPR